MTHAITFCFFYSTRCSGLQEFPFKSWTGWQHWELPGQLTPEPQQTSSAHLGLNLILRDFTKLNELMRFPWLHTGSPLQGVVSVQQGINAAGFFNTTGSHQCHFILWDSTAQEVRQGNICTCVLCVPVTDSLCMSACHRFHRKVLTALVCGQGRKQDVDQMLPRPLFLKINHLCILK